MQKKENTTLNSELPLLHTALPVTDHSSNEMRVEPAALLRWGPCRVGLVVLKSWSMG